MQPGPVDQLSLLALLAKRYMSRQLAGMPGTRGPFQPPSGLP